MQILSAQQIRKWDEFTIQHEPVASIDLMERAAAQCVQWIKNKYSSEKIFHIFCGKGNNGGDGLAMARMLLHEGYAVSVYILEFGKLGTDDFQTNLHRLHQLPVANIHFIQSKKNFPLIQNGHVVVDALYGSGLNKPLTDLSADLVHHINQSQAIVISIDLPSGLFVDQSSLGNTITRTRYTLTFQCYKTALLIPDNSPFIGEVQVLDIGLHPGFFQQKDFSREMLDEIMIRDIFKSRNRFAHKGTFGHALIAGGSYGKMGAMVLTIKACLSSGTGLTTAFIPKCGYQVMQVTTPEAMVIVDDEETHLTNLPDDIEKFTAIGIGPGMGIKPETRKLLSFIIRRYRKPIVIDADGLNCLALEKDLLEQLPPYSILTPHPKEFDRLFGEHENDFARIARSQEKARQLQIIIVLKGHHTFIALPDGTEYFNSTGNAGMAKGGSGDVLTGIITSLLSQGYSPKDATVLGVYIHGWAGDFAAKRFSKAAMLPSHTIECMQNVFIALES